MANGSGHKWHKSGQWKRKKVEEQWKWKRKWKLSGTLLLLLHRTNRVPTLVLCTLYCPVNTNSATGTALSYLCTVQYCVHYTL